MVINFIKKIVSRKWSRESAMINKHLETWVMFIILQNTCQSRYELSNFIHYDKVEC